MTTSDKEGLVKSLQQSGFTAFQNKSYRESIDYFKRAQSLGLNPFDNAEANRLIGSSYLEMKKGRKARKYLRRATASGMLSGNSILLLSVAEQMRSPFYKCRKGEDQSEVVGELLDWYLLSEMPNPEHLKVVALNAYSEKKWHKAIVLLRLLIMLDQTNVECRKLLAKSYYSVGNLFEAQVEIKNLFSNAQVPMDDLLVVKADLNMIIGEFKQAKNDYISAAKTSPKDISSLLQVLDLCIRTDEISKQFHNQAMLYLTQGYFTKSYISSIDYIKHFELVLNAAILFLKTFQDEQKRKIQELKTDTLKQMSGISSLHEENAPSENKKNTHRNEKMTLFEWVANRQKSDLEAINEFRRLSPVFNTTWNFSMTEQINRQVLESGRIIKTRLWVYKPLLYVFRFILYLIPLIIFIDGLVGAITGKSLPSLFLFTQNSSGIISGVFQIIAAVVWFLLLFFTDAVLLKKINRALVETIKGELEKYINLIGVTLVTGEAMYEYFKASQPIPHLDMQTSELLGIGLDEKKPLEIRLGALTIAEQKVVVDDLTLFIEGLKKLLVSAEEQLKFVSARLLAIAQIAEALPVINTELQHSVETKSRSYGYFSLQALGKYGNNLAAVMIRDYAIKNMEDSMIVHGCVEAIKLLPLKLRVSTVITIMESSLGKTIIWRDYINILVGLGDVTCNALLDFIDKHGDKIDFTDRIVLIDALLCSGSPSGKEKVKKWLIDSELPSVGFLSPSDLVYDHLAGNKNFALLKEIAVDNKLSKNIRRKAVASLATFEKDKVQDIVFNLWDAHSLEEDYVKILGDIGSAECLNRLLALQRENRDVPADLLVLVNYIYIFSSLAFCGDNGIKVLNSILLDKGTSKSNKLFAVAALFGSDQDNPRYIRILKRSLLDDVINKYHLSYALNATDWYISHEDYTYFKLNLLRRPSPKKYHAFLHWVKENTKLQKEIRKHADSLLAVSSMSEDSRELWVPKAQSKFSMFLGDLRSIFHKKSR